MFIAHILRLYKKSDFSVVELFFVFFQCFPKVIHMLFIHISIKIVTECQTISVFNHIKFHRLLISAT